MSFFAFNWLDIFSLRHLANVINVYCVHVVIKDIDIIHILILVKNELSLNSVSLYLWLQEEWWLVVHVWLMSVLGLIVVYNGIGLLKNILVEVYISFSINSIENFLGV